MKTLLLAALLAVTGCSVLKGHVLVDTETVLGVSLAQNETTGIYEGRLGYARHELALVPTNGPPVLTEFSMKNVFSFSPGPALYQRLAVGKEACDASYILFLKDASGNVSTQAVSAANVLLKLRGSTNN